MLHGRYSIRHVHRLKDKSERSRVYVDCICSTIMYYMRIEIVVALRIERAVLRSDLRQTETQDGREADPGPGL